MIWSIIPSEQLFPPTPDESLQVVELAGRRLTLRQGRVESLLSSNPADYLDQRFAPGALWNSQNETC